MDYTHHTKVAVSRTVAVIDGPVLQAPYTRTGETFQVDSIEIGYTGSGCGDWAVVGAYDITISGSLVLKDGRLSAKVRRSTHPDTVWVNGGRDWKLTADFEWLHAIIDDLLPIGEIV